MNLEPPVLAALVTGTASLIIALVTFFSARANQRDVEKLKAELAETKSENDARRDYVYEARKRLYKEYEPLFFQLTESAEIALGHIQSLAERGREGNLTDVRYLGKESYYLKTTVYKLLVPVAIFKLINNRLTLVDLQVDSKIYSQYYLAKLLYLTYTQDFIIARLPPPLEYDPYKDGWPELRKTNPQVYYRQGFPAGRLDNTLDALISTESTGVKEVLSFGRFEGMLKEIAETDVDSPLGVAKDMFFSFHPLKRPLLWRILICQAHIYICILRIRYQTQCDIKYLRKLSESIFALDQDRRKYDWRQNEAEAPETKVLDEPFGAAKEYLRQRLSEPHKGRSNPEV